MPLEKDEVETGSAEAEPQGLGESSHVSPNIKFV